MTKLYARIWYPGLLFPNEAVIEVSSRTERPPLEKGAYGWSFFEREVAEVNGETLSGKEKNHSPSYYLGKEYSAEEFLALPECNDIAKFNIVGNKVKRICKTIRGQAVDLRDGDIVVGEV